MSWEAGPNRETSLVSVDARNARADTAEHLVRDCTGLGGNLFGADLFVTLAAEEDDLIAERCVRNVCHIGGDQVHRDSAYDRSTPAANQYVALVREETVVS